LKIVVYILKKKEVKKIMNKALGFIEGRGFGGIVKATDQMPKVSKVEFFQYVNISGSFNSIIYSGEVGAVRAAVETTAQFVNEVGVLYATNVMPAPHQSIYDFIKNSKEVEYDSIEVGNALGIIETKGYVPMIEAADSGVKAAKVIISNWLTVGGGYSSLFFRGDVAAVTAAIENAKENAAKIGEVLFTHIIPSPHLLTMKMLPIGKPKNLKVDDNPLLKNKGAGEAIGVFETQGYTPLIEAVDAGLKSASVIVTGWYKVGSAMVSTIFRGDVAAVKTAVSAGKNAAEKLGKVLSAYVIPRPNAAVEKIV